MGSRCDRKIKPVSLRQNQTAADRAAIGAASGLITGLVLTAGNPIGAVVGEMVGDAIGAAIGGAAIFAGTAAVVHAGAVDTLKDKENACIGKGVRDLPKPGF